MTAVDDAITRVENALAALRMPPPPPPTVDMMADCTCGHTRSAHVGDGPDTDCVFCQGCWHFVAASTVAAFADREYQVRREDQLHARHARMGLKEKLDCQPCAERSAKWWARQKRWTLMGQRADTMVALYESRWGRLAS